MNEFAFRVDKKRVLISLGIIGAIYATLFLVIVAIGNFNFAAGDYLVTNAVNQWTGTFPTWYQTLLYFYTRYGYYLAGAAIFFTGMVAFFFGDRLKSYRPVLLGLLYGYFAAWVATDGVLKPLVSRPRPFQAYPGQFNLYNYQVNPPLDPSFPSGTASAAFGMSGGLMARVQNWIARILLYAYAITLSLSRSLFGVHYITDILVGSIIGLAGSLGFFVLFQFLSMKGRLTDTTMRVLFIVGVIAASITIGIDVLA